MSGALREWPAIDVFDLLIGPIVMRSRDEEVAQFAAVTLVAGAHA
jgi:hypothetical protein